jgi:hypothetical protein
MFKINLGLFILIFVYVVNCILSIYNAIQMGNV